MSTHQLVVNSDRSLVECDNALLELYRKHKYLDIKIRLGEDRSLDQNALLHVWINEFAAHLAKCQPDEITHGMADGTKRRLKAMCYNENGYDWLVYEIQCPFTKTTKRDYTSSARWKHDEMFVFLTWFQGMASQYGCVLISKGKFKKLQAEQNS